jgi:hypothetical protein
VTLRRQTSELVAPSPHEPLQQKNQSTADRHPANHTCQGFHQPFAATRILIQQIEYHIGGFHHFLPEHFTFNDVSAA